jgi:polyisoprenyl-teichoic acid--peptidoglycan teichoic acid transferase
MKRYLKILLVALAVNGLVMYGGFKYFQSHYSHVENMVDDGLTVDENLRHSDYSARPELEKLIGISSRVNFLVYGKDGARSDTIMVFSYDMKARTGDVISIPRDTLYTTPGKSLPGQNKINAVVGFSGGRGPIDLKRAVSSILGVPIDYYVELDYEGVRNIVDSVKGVEIDVPFDMNYDDVYAVPELHIHIKKGRQILNGKKAVEYLRWRKNNGMGGEGDIPRTQRQREFVKKLMRKSLSLNLPSFLKASFGSVETDMSMDRLAYIGMEAAKFSVSDLKSHVLPGRPGPRETGLYIHDDMRTGTMMADIYKSTIK